MKLRTSECELVFGLSEILEFVKSKGIQIPFEAVIDDCHVSGDGSIHLFLKNDDE